MTIVCLRVQSDNKCLVSWTIVQIEDNSLSLSEIFENIKGGRVSMIVLSSELKLEKVFINRISQLLIRPFISLMFL